MAAEKPDNQGGCQLSREQLASRLERLEGLFTKMSDMYEKRISALEKEVSSVKKEKEAIAGILLNSRHQPTKRKAIRPSQLPPELSTEKAMLLWDKLITAGLVDKNYQPQISNTQAAIVAHIMARDLGIRNKWKLFGELWNLKHLSGYLYRALNQQQSGEFMNETEKLLADS